MISDADLHKFLLSKCLHRNPYGPGYTLRNEIPLSETVDNEEFESAQPLMAYAYRLGYVSRVTPYRGRHGLCSLSCRNHYGHVFQLTRLAYDLLAPELPHGTDGRRNCLSIGSKRLQKITSMATGRKLELLTNGKGDYDAKDEDRP